MYHISYGEWDMIRSRIKEHEDKGEISLDCRMCIDIFYPKLLEGKKISNIHAPSHKPSDRCESGKRNHCSCDICF